MIYIGCATQVNLVGLTNQATGAVVNNAVVVATLFDGDGATVETVTLTASGTGGNYSGTIPASVTQGLSPGGTYTLQIVSSLSNVQIDERNEKIQVIWRGFDE